MLIHLASTKVNEKLTKIISCYVSWQLFYFLFCWNATMFWKEQRWLRSKAKTTKWLRSCPYHQKCIRPELIRPCRACFDYLGEQSKLKMSQIVEKVHNMISLDPLQPLLNPYQYPGVNILQKPRKPFPEARNKLFPKSDP